MVPILEITRDVIFQDLKILKFYDLVKLKICEVMYRAFNKTLPVNLNNIFTVCEPNCLFNMRKKKDFVHKYTRTNLKGLVSSRMNLEAPHSAIYKTCGILLRQRCIT